MVYEREQVSAALTVGTRPPPLMLGVSPQYAMCVQDDETPQGNLTLHWLGLDCAEC